MARGLFADSTIGAGRKIKAEILKGLPSILK